MSSLPPPPASPEPVPSETVDRAGADRRWGLGDFAFGLVASLVVATVVFAVVLGVTGHDEPADLPLWLFGLSNASLHVALAAVAVAAAVTKGNGPLRDFRIWFKATDVGTGVLSGVLAQLALVPLVTLPVLWLFDQDFDDVSESARELSDRATSAIGVVTLIITVCLVAPAVEEVFYRGLGMEAYKKRINLPWLGGRSLSARWNIGIAVVFSSAIFSATHFQPILFPALFAVGGLFAVLAQRAGRLGPAIWAHIGFNGTAVLTLLVLDDESALALFLIF